jgi:hypothetical protein
MIPTCFRDLTTIAVNAAGEGKSWIASRPKTYGSPVREKSNMAIPIERRTTKREKLQLAIKARETVTR